MQQQAASSDWAGLSWGWVSGSLKSSRSTASQQLHSFRGSSTLRWSFVVEFSRPVTFVSIFFGVPVSDAKLSPKLSSLDSGQGWGCTLMLRRKNKANPDNWLESDECVRGAGRVVEFRLVFSRWYRGGVKSQFDPIQ